MPTLTGKKIKNTYFNLLQISQVGNVGLDGTSRNVEDGKGLAAPFQLSQTVFTFTGTLNATSIIQQNCTLSAATGDQIAVNLAYTVNKATSGNDTGFKLTFNDVATPGTSKLTSFWINANEYVAEYWDGSNLSFRHRGGAIFTSLYGYEDQTMIVAGSTDGNNPAYVLVGSNTPYLNFAQNSAGVNFSGSNNAENGIDTGINRAAAGVIKVTNGSSGYGTLAAAGLQTGAYTAVADGKAILNITMDDATGDEYGLKLTQTTNKATSGNDTTIRADWTDTNSPGTSYLLEGYNGANREFSMQWGPQSPSLTIKATGAGDRRSSVAVGNQASKYIQIFANGTGTTNGILPDDTGIYYDPNSNRGVPILSSQLGAFDYGYTVQAGVRIGEHGGSSTVDVGIIRGGAGILRVFNGDVNAPATAKLMTSALVAPDGSPDCATLNNDGSIQFGGATHYAKFDNAGHLTLNGDATVWDDLRIGAAQFEFPGGADPDLISYAPNGGGINWKMYEFAVDDYVQFAIQLPHSYKVGSKVYFHVHWTPGDRGNEENAKNVNWELKYIYAPINGTWSAEQTINSEDACDGTDHKHQMSPDTELTGYANFGISTQIICQLKRIAASADGWVSTTTGQLPILVEVDFHYEMDTIGSNGIGTK